MLTQCGCSSPTSLPVSVPGVAGESAFTTTTASFIVPAADANVSVSLANTGWMVVGQIVVADGPFHFEVISKTTNSAVLKWLDYAVDGATLATVAPGSTLAPAGEQGPVVDPLPIANGGTGQITAALARTAILESAPLAIAEGGTAGATKAAAQTALGLGQDAVISTVTGLAQAVTNSAAQVAGCDVTISAAGYYLVGGLCTIGITGVTFAADRTLTVKVRNVTQGVDVVSTTRKTGIYTTLTNASQEVNIPPVLYSAGVASDHLQIMVALDTVNSAGTYAALNATLCIVPLRKT